MTELSNKGCDTLSQRAIAYGLYNNDRYILVSTLHGEDLTALIGKNNISEIKRVSLLAVDAIESIHKCGFVHRDIKHENMVYEKYGKRDGNVVIIDHGLTESVFDRKGDRKKRGTPNEGSPLYMSINQHKGMAIDYMFDLEAIAYMILDFLGKLRWRGTKNNRLEEKENFLAEYLDGKLTGNEKAMGELINYTNRNTIVDYKPEYYNEVKKIINKIV